MTFLYVLQSHPMSLRRAVTGRSKPFDQLLADHRQAKEALIQAKKKNLEQQNASVTLTPPAAQVIKLFNIYTYNVDSICKKLYLLFNKFKHIGLFEYLHWTRYET